MKKPKVIFLVLLCILVTAVLAAPVSAGIVALNDVKITATDGSTSPSLWIADQQIEMDGTITINVSELNSFVANGTFSNYNVIVTSFTSAATWTGSVAENTLTLTSTGGATLADEGIGVTFTGAQGNPWINYTAGDRTVTLTANRTDGFGETTFNFMIQTGGLKITPGETITTPDGNTTSVITNTDAEIAPDGTVTVGLTGLNGFVANNTFTEDNVIINDTAADAIWMWAISGDPQILTLTSTGGATHIGENITVTFTGAKNPWVADTAGVEYSYPLVVTRTDGLGAGTIYFPIFTAMPPPPGLNITEGEKIWTAHGSTSPIITVTDTEISPDYPIFIDVSNLNPFFTGGLTIDNINIMSDAAAATWTGTIGGDPLTLTLTSTGGSTAIGENITVTFRGTTDNPWADNMIGPVFLTATRSDGFSPVIFPIRIDTTPQIGLTIGNGEKITATDGVTSTVFTITNNDIVHDGTITVDISGLDAYVAGGNFTDANIIVNDNATVASWTGTVTGHTLTLTSTLGNTTVGENVTVSFTGAGGNAWIGDTHGNKTVVLIANRTDGLGKTPFNFVIETAPLSGYSVAANFSAVWTTDIPPVSVSFTDTSQGNATSWLWDFGDGTTSPDQNPVHIYNVPGIYNVSLTASNIYSSDTKTQTNYITVLNGAVREANTSISGLTVTSCGSPQSITVDTSILPSILTTINAGSSVFPDSALTIQPPTDSGFKNITMYALDGTGFSRNGNQITGNLSGVHLETEEIAPSLGFSSTIGTNASFSYSVDLSYYPCNAILNTKIWEGVITDYNAKLWMIATNNSASPIGTAYSANISKINFPNGTNVKVHMSVNSSWNTYPNLQGGPGKIFIWRIADDGNSGQILPTNLSYSDPVNNLDYLEADSPLGMSTFGLSSLTGNNNPFQVIAFIAVQVVNPPASQEYSAGGGGGGPGTVQTTVTGTPVPDQTTTTRIYTNTKGTIMQATTLQSADGLANISLERGIVALNTSGQPLESLSIRSIPASELPAVPPDATLSFAGMAYEIGPDGATFTPAVPLSFTLPPEMGGQDYVIHEYDHATGTWLDLPTDYNPQTRTITVQVSHLCCFALFEVSMQPAPTPEPTILISSKSSVQTNVEMYEWVFAMVTKNPVIIVIILAALAVVAYFGWWKRRL